MFKDSDNIEEQKRKKVHEKTDIPINEDNDKEKRLKELIQESKQIFLSEQKEVFTRALYDLLEYCLQPNKETAEKLELFFHTLHGSAATLEVIPLAELGAEFEDYIDKNKGNSDLADRFLVKLLKGLALTHQSLENMQGQDLLQKIIIEGTEEGKEKDTQIKNVKANILLLNSDNGLLEQLEKAFAERGYYLLVSNSHEVKSILKEEKVDLVLLDAGANENEALGTLDIIQEEQEKLPVLFIAKDSVAEAKIKAIKAGVEDYIPKPFTIEELIIRIEHALKESHLPGVPYVDNLTGTYTMEYLDKQMKVGASQGQGFASLALIDVSWIKEINDSLGYSSGDVVLKEFIQKLKEQLMDSDQIYRLGGLEFAVLLPDQNTEQGVEKLIKFKNEIGILKFRHRDTDIPLRPSFTSGIVMFEYEENLTLASLLEQGRQALTSSKSSGKGIFAYQNSQRKKKKVLLVEDTDFIVHYVQGKLQTMSIEVHNAKDGEEGVRKAQIEQPDLMIIDLMLPKMDGFEVCRQIKTNPKTKATKIIIMSSRKSKEDVLRCYNLGIDDYIVKPFTLEDFEQRIKRLL